MVLKAAGRSVHASPIGADTALTKTPALSLYFLDRRLSEGAVASVRIAMPTPSAHVNVFVGTQQTGNTFPGATLPHGMAQLSPVAIPDSGGVWLWNSGYHRNQRRDPLDPLKVVQSRALRGVEQSPMQGFGHTALSGTGLNDGADFVLLPCVGGSQGCAGAVLQHDAHEEGAPGYYKARVGFPSSTSGAAHVDVEVTAALRGGLLRARFGGLGERRLRVSLQTRLDALVERDSSVQLGSRPGELRGTRSSRRLHHCAADHTAYWHATTEPPFDRLERLAGGKDGKSASEGTRGLGPPVWEAVWDDAALETVTVRTFLSHVDEAGAEANALAELPGRPFDFEGLRANATRTWDATLALASATSADERILRTYYTALYHSFLGPTLLSDANGAYRLGGRGAVHLNAPPHHTQYSTFSLWDTYRAQHVLLTLLEPELSADFAHSLLAIADVSHGRLPRWVRRPALSDLPRSSTTSSHELP